MRIPPVRPGRGSLLAGLTALLLTMMPVSADAATPTFTAQSLSASVSGSTVRVSAVLTASSAVTADRYGVCARSATGVDEDFVPLTDIAIDPAGTAYTQSQVFASGTHSYFVCVQIDGMWHNVGSAKTFTVNGTTSAPVVAGWSQVFSDDFDTPVGVGAFVDSSYAARWFAYDGYRDTSGRGLYDRDSVLSVRNGSLDWYVHTTSGTPRVGAVVARSPKTGWGQTYGRYSFRFRSDLLPGYKLACMLWPDSDNWGEGEIDFPEVGALDATNNIYANLYQPGNTKTGTPGPTRGFATGVAAAGTGWHTAVIEWSPAGLTFILDGRTLGTLSSSLPKTSFHLVLQVETTIGGPAPASSVAGHVNVDSVTISAYTP